MNAYQNNEFYSGGKHQWHQTEEYRQKVKAIKEEVMGNYQPLLQSEENWFKQQWLKFKLHREVNRRIAEINSTLHLTSTVRNWNLKIIS